MREGDRSSTHGAGRTRARSGLVIAEVALAVVVVVAAGLVVRSFNALVSIDPGFEPRGVLTASVSLPQGSYPEPSAVQAFHERMIERFEALPGVTAASGMSALPLDGGNNGVWDFDVDGRAEPGAGEPAFNGEVIVMMSGIDEALGMRLVEGRFFDAGDREGSQRVVIVNRRLARTFFADESALGQRLRVAGLADAPWLTIVGVVEDFRNITLDTEPLAGWYTPFGQANESIGLLPRRLSYVIRTSGDPALLAGAVRSAVSTEDPALPVTALGSMESVVHDSLSGERFTLRVLGVFAGLALLLGTIGLYGTLSCAVAERTRELGIRRALGASGAGILAVVGGQGMRLTLLGLLIGVAAALAGTRLLGGLLYGVRPTDPATFAAVAVAMLVAAAVATTVPVLRAIRLDPVDVLRDG
jgi:predicted permease